MTLMRLIRLGGVAPLKLHAAYTGLAEAQGDTADPLLVLGHSEIPHLSIGASQYASAELDLAGCRQAGVPIIQRPLGGGAVWVDADQLCLFLILPSAHAPLRPAGLFRQGTELVAATYRACGLPVGRLGERDLTIDGRKIGGSGAGRIGRAGVFASSILRRFPVSRFAASVNADPDFRRMLEALLQQHMTCWADHATPPDWETLVEAVQTAAAAMGREIVESTVTAAEARAIEAAEAELAEPLEDGPRRLVRGGLKVRHGVYLLAGEVAGYPLRMTLVEGRIRALVPAGPALPAGLAVLIGEPAETQQLKRRLNHAMPADHADAWAQGLAALAEAVPPEG